MASLCQVGSANSESVMPGDFDQHAARRTVAGLGDALQWHTLAGSRSEGMHSLMQRYAAVIDILPKQHLVWRALMSRPHNISMDLETLLKLFSLFAGAFALWKIVVEVGAGRRSRFRDEYKFAREFLDDIRKTPQMHPFLRQKGYQALAGDNRLNAQEVEYLLTLPESARALRLYVMGLPYLQHTATALGSPISFKPKYVGHAARFSRKVAYLVAYGVFYALGAAPLFSLPLSLFGLTRSPSLFLTTALFCWPLAGLSLWSGMRIMAAESLVGASSYGPDAKTAGTL